jgi:hypothetical protein
MVRPLVLASVTVLAATACGPSVASVRAAREARYDTSFATVWDACLEEVHKRYVGIHLEDAVSGRIETDYRVIERTNEDVTSRNPSGVPPVSSTGAAASTPGARTTSSLTGPSQANYVSEGAIFRMTVQVYGPPWKVIVDGVAADYKPGMAVPIIYQHGAIDEPPWVQTRMDNLSMAIYQRLKQYAVADQPVQVVSASAASEEERAKAWANLDPAAARVVASLRKAADARDVASLRLQMIVDFHWAEGADTSADTALAVWSADPGAFRALAHTLEAGCAPDAGGDLVCPVKSGPELGHARLRQVGATWKLVEFLR